MSPGSAANNSGPIATSFIPAHCLVRVDMSWDCLINRSAEAGGVMFTLSPILKLLLWPLALVGALLVFGISSQSLVALVTENAKVTSVSWKHSAAAPVVSRTMLPTPTLAIPPTLATATLQAPSAEAAAIMRPTAPSSRPQMVVLSSGLTIHAKAKKSSAALGALRQKDLVEVLGSQGNWLLIRQGSVTGWVSRKYLRAMAAAATN